MSRKRYQTGEQNQRLFQVVCLDELVPENHLLRQIDAALDLSFIRELVHDTYDHETDRGRPPWDPVLLFRMMLIGFLFDLSDHRLEQEVRMHAGYRWFLGLDFEDPVPDRTTLIRARQRWGTATFEAIFQRVVQQCAAAGLVRGETLAADGTQVRARAATRSLEQQVHNYLEAWNDEDVPDDEDDDDDGVPSPIGRSSRRQAGDPNFHGEHFSNSTHRSRTDPEARLSRKGPGQEAYLRYYAHYVLDADTGVILGAAASQVYGQAEREVTLALLDELRGSPYLADHPWVYLDRAYGEGGFLADLLALGYLPCVRLPNPEPEPIPAWQRRTNRLDHFRNRQKRIRVAEARNMVRALVQHRPEPFERIRVRIEHAFAEAKEWHGLARARGYGLETCHWQVLMTATAQNLKRLARNVRRRWAGGPARALVLSSQSLARVASQTIQPLVSSLVTVRNACCLMLRRLPVTP